MTRDVILVDFVADPVCPWCYVGLKSLQSARASLPANLGVKLRFRAYQLNPDLVVAGVDREAYYAAKFPDAERRTAMRARLIESAQGAGVDFDPATPKWLPNTLKAHQLIRIAHAAGVAEQVADEIYDAFWLRGEDIGDIEVLVSAAMRGGLDGAAARASLATPADAVAEEAAAFARAGVSGVPTFIVNERTGFSGALPPSQLAQALQEGARRA